MKRNSHSSGAFGGLTVLLLILTTLFVWHIAETLPEQSIKTSRPKPEHSPWTGDQYNPFALLRQSDIVDQSAVVANPSEPGLTKQDAADMSTQAVSQAPLTQHDNEPERYSLNLLLLGDYLVSPIQRQREYISLPEHTYRLVMEFSQEEDILRDRILEQEIKATLLYPEFTEEIKELRLICKSRACIVSGTMTKGHHVSPVQRIFVPLCKALGIFATPYQTSGVSVKQGFFFFAVIEKAGIERLPAPERTCY